ALAALAADPPLRPGTSVRWEAVHSADARGLPAAAHLPIDLEQASVAPASPMSRTSITSTPLAGAVTGVAGVAAASGDRAGGASAGDIRTTASVWAVSGSDSGWDMAWVTVSDTAAMADGDTDIPPMVTGMRMIRMDRPCTVPCMLTQQPTLSVTRW